MKKPFLTLVLLVGGLAPAAAQECVHGPAEAAADRTRREQALQFARRLNVEQQLHVPSRRPGRRYGELDELRPLPPVPDGFLLQFHTDGMTYAFSLKDQRDPCRFAVFSDQTGDVYAAIRQSVGAAVMIPAETR